MQLLPKDPTFEKYPHALEVENITCGEHWSLRWKRSIWRKEMRLPPTKHNYVWSQKMTNMIYHRNMLIKHVEVCFVLQETWCSGPSEWLRLGAKWATWYNHRREGCGGFHFNLAWWIVSIWLCCVLECNCHYDIINSFGILTFFVYFADIHYWSIQESDEKLLFFPSVICVKFSD